MIKFKKGAGGQVKVKRFSSPETFLAHIEDCLLKNEAVNNLPLCFKEKS
ncbi:hypothetical protein [Bacillus swezeyi]